MYKTTLGLRQLAQGYMRLTGALTLEGGPTALVHGEVALLVLAKTPRVVGPHQQIGPVTPCLPGVTTARNLCLVSQTPRDINFSLCRPLLLGLLRQKLLLSPPSPRMLLPQKLLANSSLLAQSAYPVLSFFSSPDMVVQSRQGRCRGIL